jgi:hypothetical protein
MASLFLECSARAVLLVVATAIILYATARQTRRRKARHLVRRSPSDAPAPGMDRLGTQGVPAPPPSPARENYQPARPTGGRSSHRHPTCEFRHTRNPAARRATAPRPDLARCPARRLSPGPELTPAAPGHWHPARAKANSLVGVPRWPAHQRLLCGSGNRRFFSSRRDFAGAVDRVAASATRCRPDA